MAGVKEVGKKESNELEEKRDEKVYGEYEERAGRKVVDNHIGAGF